LVKVLREAEHKKTLISMETPIYNKGDENEIVLMDVISEEPDSESGNGVRDFGLSIEGEYLINKYSQKVSLKEISEMFSMGDTVQDVCNKFFLTEYEVLKSFEKHLPNLFACVGDISDKNMDKYYNKLKKAETGLRRAEAEAA